MFIRRFLLPSTIAAGSTITGRRQATVKGCTACVANAGSASGVGSAAKGDEDSKSMFEDRHTTLAAFASWIFDPPSSLLDFRTSVFVSRTSATCRGSDQCGNHGTRLTAGASIAA